MRAFLSRASPHTISLSRCCCCCRATATEGWQCGLVNKFVVAVAYRKRERERERLCCCCLRSNIIIIISFSVLLSVRGRVRLYYLMMMLTLTQIIGSVGKLLDDNGVCKHREIVCVCVYTHTYSAARLAHNCPLSNCVCVYIYDIYTHIIFTAWDMLWCTSGGHRANCALRNHNTLFKQQQNPRWEGVHFTTTTTTYNNNNRWWYVVIMYISTVHL